MTATTGSSIHPWRGVMFADLADSSRLFRELGDDGAIDVVGRALDLARCGVECEAGEVVETIGDELFCLFPDGDRALSAALRIQHATADSRCAGELPPGLAFRIGLVHGPVGLSAGQVFGDTVYLAKRVSTTAKADQILTTEATRRGLSGSDPDSFRALDRLRLKGRVDEVQLVEAVWGEDVTLQTAEGAPVPRLCATEQLALSHAGRAVVVSRDLPSVTLGRGVTCDLRIDDSRVSRLHARVAMERERFVLRDLSQNGTTVTLPGAAPRTVVRSTCALTRRGTLRIGSHGDAALVEYAVRPRATTSGD